MGLRLCAVAQELLKNMFSRGSGAYFPSPNISLQFERQGLGGRVISNAVQEGFRYFAPHPSGRLFFASFYELAGFLSKVLKFENGVPQGHDPGALHGRTGHDAGLPGAGLLS